MEQTKHCSLGFLLLLLLFLGIGCSETKQNATSFVFATWAAGEELKQFQAIVDQVNQAANGRFDVEVLSVPSDYYVKLSTFIAAKKTPDFFWLTQELIAKYAALGVIADLSDNFRGSTRLTPEQYYPGVLRSAEHQGRYYGLPWIANPLMVYYNKKAFDEAGIPYPDPRGGWTWEEFIRTAQALTVTKKDSNGNDYRRFGYIVDGWPNLETFLWAGGGDVIAADGQTVLLDSPASLAGLGILHDILKAGISPAFKDVGSLGSNNVWFEKQRAAMFMGGIQDNFEAKQARLPDAERFDIGYAPMPVGRDGRASSFDWTASTVMDRKIAANPLAYEVLETLTLEFFRWKIAPPVTGSIDRVAAIDPLKKPALETIHISLENARSANYVPEWNEINHLLWLKLYVGMLNDVEFDYQAEARSIAAAARALLAKRTAQP